MNVPVWEDGGWAGLPALREDIATDVCVVGLGGAGLAAVHELLDLGVRAVGIDAASVAAGAAGRNGGFLLAGTYDFYHDAVARHGRERAHSLYVQTLGEIERMRAETPTAVRITGSLRIASSPEEEVDCTAQLQVMQRDGLPVDAYAGAEGRGLLIPGDGVFNPLLRCRLRAAAAIERGALLFEHSPALDISPGVVHTPRARVECAAVIVALDGGLARALPELRGRVRTARLQMLATAPTRDVSLPRPVYRRYGFEYWQQLPDGRIALGGFRDRVGAAEWTDSSEPTPAVQALLERHLRDVIGVTAPVERRWAATVGYTGDGLPICEQVRPSVWAIGAYSGTGNVIGALCGRAAARAAALGDTSHFPLQAGSAPARSRALR